MQPERHEGARRLRAAGEGVDHAAQRRVGTQRVEHGAVASNDVQDERQPRAFGGAHVGAQHRELPLEVDLRLHATVEAAFADRDGAETLGGVDELRFEHERVERGIEMLGVMADRHRESDVGVPTTHERVRAFPLGPRDAGQHDRSDAGFRRTFEDLVAVGVEGLEVEVGVGVEETHRGSIEQSASSVDSGCHARGARDARASRAAVSERPRRHVTSTTEDGTTSAAEDGTTNAA